MSVIMECPGKKTILFLVSAKHTAYAWRSKKANLHWCALIPQVTVMQVSGLTNDLE